MSKERLALKGATPAPQQRINCLNGVDGNGGFNIGTIPQLIGLFQHFLIKKSTVQKENPLLKLLALA